MSSATVSNCSTKYCLKLFHVQIPFAVFPSVDLFVFSSLTLCSMILLNYLGHKGAESGMVAGFTISVPWDALKSSVSMEEPLNWLLFNTYLTRGLQDAVIRSEEPHKSLNALC